MIEKTARYFFASIFLIAAVSGSPACPAKAALLRPLPGLKPNSRKQTLLSTPQRSSSAPFMPSRLLCSGKLRTCRAGPVGMSSERILSVDPSLRDPDNEAEITPGIRSRLSEWRLKWKTPWEKTLQDYHGLVDRCTILKVAKRLAVRQNLLPSKLQVYVGAVMMDVSAGREKEGKEIFSVVEALDKSNADLIPTISAIWDSMRPGPGGSLLPRHRLS